MKTLLKQLEKADAEAARALRVIDEFDRLVAREVPLERLASAAARLSGRTVGVEETLNDRRIVLGSPARSRPPTVAEDVSAAAVARKLRGRRAARLSGPFGEVVAASVDVASGRIGTVWLADGDRPWDTLDDLIAERLAAATAIDALRERERRRALEAHDAAALERILLGDVDGEQLEAIARRAGLDPAGRYAAVALEERPVGAVSPEVLVRLAERTLREEDRLCRGVVLGRSAAIVVEPADDPMAGLAGVPEAAARRGFAVLVGVGEPAGVGDLRRSWREAREALTLGALAGGPGITRFRDLGALSLLARIPREELAGCADLERVGRLQAGREPDDLRLLETYCETGSLRRTAERLHLHHSTVDYRVKRIERVLGFSLAEPAGRLRALLAVKLTTLGRTPGP